MAISNLNEPVALLLNESPGQGNWMALRLVGRGSCRTAIGATAIARIGDRSQLRQIRGGSSYISTSDTKLHFGCGNAARIDELTVTWPSGRKSKLRDIACNRVLTVIEPEP
jgi:enediyne biosynthesis protein E4